MNKKIVAMIIVIGLMLMPFAIVGVGEQPIEEKPRTSYTISNVWELQNMSNDLSGDYNIINDIDATITSSWNGGLGFKPVGNYTTSFRGTLDGQNYTIYNLFINRTSENYIGLVGLGDGSVISNVRLSNIDVTGDDFVGGLVGQQVSSSISNSYSTGNVTSNYYVGGLVGRSSSSSSINKSYSTGNVTGIETVGGLVGLQFGSSTINNSYSTGNVTGIGTVGGLVGQQDISTISNSYSTGNVTSNYDVGGLVGKSSSSTISNSYYDMDTSGQSDTGKGTPKTTEQMKSLVTYSAWDIDVKSLNYTINNGYPVLNWQLTNNSPTWYLPINSMSHSPIRINNNSCFNFTNGVTGGSGTAGDPYIIDNWYINAIGYGSGIYVGNTTKHFIIRNCSIINASGYVSNIYYYESGINIFQSTNGTIHNNTFLENRRAIHLYAEPINRTKYGNMMITDNRIHHEVADGMVNHGMYLRYMMNITIDGNNISDHYGSAISTQFSDNITVMNNEISNNANMGIRITDSNNNITVNNNTILNIPNPFYMPTGISIEGCTNGSIYDNYIYDMGTTGIDISDTYLTNNITIRHNNIIDCLYGIRLTSAGVTNCTAYHNNLINNSHQMVMSSPTTTNKFDLGHQWGGNYYDDLITEDNYHGINQDLAGGDNLNDSYYGYDNYPLIQPFETNNTPVAEAGADNWTARIHYISAYESSDAGGTSLNYTWNFTYNSNPYTYYTMNFSFNFAIQGNYTIYLNVTDSDGNWDTDTKIVHAIPLTANAGADDSIYRGVSYQFNASDSIDPLFIANYTWNFTYNSTNTYLYGEKPTFVFWTLGIYNVTLNVTDIYSSTDEDWVIINVSNHPPIVDAGKDQAGLRGIYTLDGSASYDIDGTIVNYTWNFTYNGNPQTLYLTYPMFNFQILGDYLITLNVTDNDGGYDYDTTWVNISNANPVANAGADQGTNKGTYTLDGSASYDIDGTIVNYTWDFTYDGSPTYLYGVQPSFDFLLEGDYLITLNVTDSDSGYDYDTTWVNITFKKPVSSFSISPSGTLRGSRLIDGNLCTDADGTIVNYTYEWEYNSITYYRYIPQFSFDFLLEGTYNITLNITDDDGLQDETYRVFEVILIDPVAIISDIPSVIVEDNITSVLFDSEIFFDGSKSYDLDGTIVNYTWSFTYNNVSYEYYGVNFTFRFDEVEGNVTITLNITDDSGRSDEATIQIEVKSAGNYLADLLILLLPLFIILMLLLVIVAYTRKSTEQEGGF